MKAKSDILRAAIRGAGYTVGEFAVKVGLEPSELFSATSGHGITKRVCERVSDGLGVDYSWLESSREIVRYQKNGR